MSRGGEQPSKRRGLLDWKGLLGIAVSAALLYYAFRDVDPGEVWTHVGEANLPLLALAGIVATLPFPFRALRWGPLLRPVHPTSRFRPRFAATCIGFMANNLLPARVGEFARAYALTRLEPVRVPASFGSLVVERLFDGATVILLLLGALAWPSFPDVSGRDFGSAALWMAALFTGAFAVVLSMVVWPERSVRAFEKTVARVLPGAVRRPVVDALEAFLAGLGALRDPRLVAEIAGWSLATWLVGALGFWVGMHAFGIEQSFVAAVFLQSIIALAVSIPSAPGFFGVFEAAARVGLVEVWGVGSSPAVAFAIGFHLAGFIPVTVIGLYYLWRLGISWRDVGESEEVVETAVENGTTEPGRSAGGSGPGPERGP